MDTKTPTPSRLAGLPAVLLRQMILDGDISVPELVEDSLTAIEETDGGLHAFVATCPERARREAREAQERLRSGEAPPLLGLPLAVKDAEPVAGLPFGSGSLVHAGRVAEADSVHVARLRAAGAIVVGKTNTPEFTLLGETYNRLGPDTRNPWDPCRSPGGSSGGSAAALAAGMVPLATGSDTAGSITVPAAFCWLVGLKPSHRRIPVWPDGGDWLPFSDVGPMARTIPDLAAMLAVASGPDPRDPHAPLFETAPEMPRHLRVAWAPTLAGLPVEPVCAEAARELAEILHDMGHEVCLDTPEIADPGPVLDLLGAIEEYRARGSLLDDHASLLMPETRAILELGRDASERAVREAREAMHGIASAFRAFMAERDLLVVPATACPAFPLRRPPARIGGKAVRPDWPSYAPFNMLANLTGLPVATLPMRLTAEGLPVGALVFASFGRDDLLLSILARAEQMRGAFPSPP